MQAVPDDPFSLRQPHSLQELGLSFSLVLELVLKHAYFEGTATLSRLAERSKLSPNIVHAVYRHLHKEQLCDTRAMIDNDYEISLNSRGRAVVEVAIRKSQYAGPAPVTLTDYRKTVSRQALKLDLTADDLRREVRTLARAGKSDDEIRVFLVARYGDFILYDPPVKPRTWLLWFGPFALLVAGAGVWLMILRRRSKGGDETALATSGITGPGDAKARARAWLDEEPPGV